MRKLLSLMLLALLMPVMTSAGTLYLNIQNSSDLEYIHDLSQRVGTSSYNKAISGRVDLSGGVTFTKYEFKAADGYIINTDGLEGHETLVQVTNPNTQTVTLKVFKACNGENLTIKIESENQAQADLYSFTITGNDLSQLQYGWGMTPKAWNNIPANGVVGTSSTQAVDHWLNIRAKAGYELTSWPSTGNYNTGTAIWSIFVEELTLGTSFAFASQKEAVPTYYIKSKANGKYLDMNSGNLHLLGTDRDVTSGWEITPFAGSTNGGMQFKSVNTNGIMWCGSAVSGTNYNGWSKKGTGATTGTNDVQWIYSLEGTTATKVTSIVSGGDYLIVGNNGSHFYQLLAEDWNKGTATAPDYRTRGELLSDYTAGMETFTFNGNANAIWILTDINAPEPLTYTGKLDITMAGEELTKGQEATINIIETGEGKCTFSLPNFTLENIGNLGDIVIPDVTMTTADGQTNYSGSLDDLSLWEGNIHASVTINGHITDAGAILFNIGVVWHGGDGIGDIPISVVFYTGDAPTGIENVTEQATAREYYDLQGRRVMNPQHGIFIMRSGNKAIKVIK